MSTLDPVSNFALCTVSTGYDSLATSVDLVVGGGAKLPDPATDGHFNLVWWEASSFSNPADDPYKEIVRVTAKSGETLTITRAQEGTTASDHNIANKTYCMILAITKKQMDDIADHVSSTSNPHSVTASQVGLGNVSNVAQIPLTYLDTDTTLAANSDTRVASQRAVKDYIDTGLGTKEDSLGYTAENVANKDTDASLTADSDTRYPSQKAVRSFVVTGLATKEDSLGYTAENSANKDTDNTLAANSDTRYPSQKAIKSFVTTGLASKQDSLGFTAEDVANKDTDITLAANSDTKYASQKAVKAFITSGLATKQATLVSGTNIKTINGDSILGSGDLVISVGIPTEITVANEASDTTTFPLFVTAATGDLAPKTNSGLSFNSATSILTATGFSGPLTGNVTGNVSGSAGSVTGLSVTSGKTLSVSNSLTLAGTDGSTLNVGTGGTLGTGAFATIADYATLITPIFPSFITVGVATGSTGSVKFKGTTSGTVVLSVADAAGTWTLKLPTSAGTNGYVLSTDGSGNTSWVAQNTNASTVTAADESADTTTFPLFVTAATGNLAPKTNSGLAFNSATGVLTATGFSGPLTGNVTGDVSGNAGTVSGLSVTSGKTLSVSNTLTLAGTDSSTLNIGTGGTLGTGAFATIANYATLATPVFTSNITLGVASSATGSALFKGLTSGTVTLSVADAAGTWTMKLPTGAGTNGYVLATDGSGNTSWVAQSGGGGTPTAITVANEASDTSCFPLFVTAATGDLGPKTNSGLSFNSSTSILTATGFSGDLTGNVTGNVSGSAGSVTGLSVTSGKTLSVSNTLTLAGTDSSTLDIGSGGTLGTGAFATISDYAPLATPVFTSNITVGVASGSTGSVILKGTTSGTVTLSVADAAGTWTMKLPTSAGTNGYVLVTDGSGNTSWSAAGSGSGDVVGPGSATDNALARFDSTTGKLIQNSVVTLNDGGDLDGILSISTSPVKTTSGTDIMIDGDFELWNSSSDLTDWAFGQVVGTGTLARESSIVHSGTYSAHFTGNGGGSGSSELLVDWGFETWSSSSVLTNWSTNVAAGSPTLTQEGTIKHGGTYSARIDGNGTNPDLLGLESNLSTGLNPGDTITFSGWANNNGGSGEGGAFFLNDTITSATKIWNFTTVGWDTISAGAAWSTIFGAPSDYIKSTSGATTWQQFSGTLTVPSNGQAEMVAMGVPAGGGSFTVYIDDFSMTVPVTGTSDVAFVESTPVSSLNPGDIYTFTAYQRNASGTGNGNAVVMFFDGTTTGTATQIYNFYTSAWVSWVDWATTVLGPNTSHFFGGSATETTSWASFSASVPTPASGILVAAVAGIPNGSGSFSVYIDTATFTSAPPLVSLYNWKNLSDVGDMTAYDRIIDAKLKNSGSDFMAFVQGGDGKFHTDFSSFDFSEKTVQVGSPSSNSDAVTKLYFANHLVDAFPSQTGNNGKFLKTDGTNISWDTVPSPSYDLTSSNFANQGSTTTVLHGNASGNLSFGAVNLSTEITGTLGIGNGGTGETTAQAAFDALSPLTTVGDLIFFDGSNNNRLAGNTTTSLKFLSQIGDGVNTTGMSWQSMPLAGNNIFVFANAGSDISTYYQMPSLLNYSTWSLGTVTTNLSTTPTVMAIFATNSGYPNTTIIPSGMVTCHFDTQKASGANNYYTYFELYKRNLAGSETLLMTSDNSSSQSVNTNINVTVSGFLSSDTTLLTTDRLVIKVYGVMVSSTANVDLKFDDSTSARMEMPRAGVDATNFVPYIGATATLDLGSHDLMTSGAVGSMGSRVTNGWFADLTVTNAISADITGNAATATLADNVTTNADLTGPITSSGNATSVASQTGTGSTFVMDTSPTLVTPDIGSATATTVNKLTITTPATGSTLTIADGKTLTVDNTLTFTGTDGSSADFGTGGTVAYLANTLDEFGAPAADVDWNSKKITNLQDPGSNQDAATKIYVDTSVSGLTGALSLKATVRLTSAAALPTCSYDNGTSGVGATLTGSSNGLLQVDSVNVATNDRVLIKDQGNPLENGVYDVTFEGDGSNPFILTRSTDSDTSSEIMFEFMFTRAGSTNSGLGFVNTNATTIAIGTDSITFAQFSYATAYTAGNGLTLTGGVFAIDTSITVDVDSTQTITNKTLNTAVINSPTGLVKADVGLSSVDDVQQLPMSYLDTDGTLASNSDSLVPSQKAVKTYADTKVTANAPITGATKTKITYSVDGLVTAGADATTSDIAEGSNLYYTDARARLAISYSGDTAVAYDNSTGIISFSEATIDKNNLGGSPLSIGNGGTGANNSNDALNALLPNQSTHGGNVLTTDGTDTSWLAIPDFTTFMTLAGVETVTGAKSFNDGKLKLNGATSGTSILKAAAVAGTTTLTLPAVSDTIAVLGNTLDQFGAPAANVSFNSKKITNLQDPTSPQDASTKAYTDSVAQGLLLKQFCILATAAALPACTYNNGSSGVGATLTGNSTGVLTVDGTSVALNDRVLVKDQASGLQNGIYDCTTEGDVSTAFVLTRATDSDTGAEIRSEYTFIVNGTANGDKGFVNTNPSSPTIGTDAITYTIFSSPATYSAGTGLSLSGSTFAIDTATTVDKTTAQTLTNKTLTSPVINTPSGITATDVGLGNVTNAAQIPLSYLDTDGTLAANSDTKVASQKAVKTYADGKVTKNSTITGATKTKITYDAKGLVTAGADATTSDIAEGSNLYYTDARARAAFSASGTGLTYSTGVFTLTASAIDINTFGGSPLGVSKGGTGLTSTTAGQVFFGAFAQDSNFYWDNTNKRLSLGFGTSPTATLHLKAGSTSAGSAPLKIANGTVMTSPEANAIENDGTNLFFTDSTPTRQTIATTSSTQTFTNKRITKRVTSITSSSTPTPNADTTDQYNVTALAASATFGAPTGTPTDGQMLSIRIKDNGTAQGLSFNAIYRFSSDLTAPATTVISKTMYLLFEYNAADVKWDNVSRIANF